MRCFGGIPRESANSRDRLEHLSLGMSATRSASGESARPATTAREQSLHAGALADRWFPQDPLLIVPLAVALGTVMQSAEAAILLATNVGGDSDSVASIAGGILGARCPETMNDDWYAVVEQVNGHDLVFLAEHLAALRS